MQPFMPEFPRTDKENRTRLAVKRRCGNHFSAHIVATKCQSEGNAKFRKTNDIHWGCEFRNSATTGMMIPKETNNQLHRHNTRWGNQD
jgi:hypothetical protein